VPHKDPIARREYNKGRWGRMTNKQRRKNYDTRLQRMYAQRSAIATIKIESGCIDCGYNQNPIALDFDHTGKKLFNINTARASRSFTVLLDEIDKCEIRCANCHRIKTEERTLAQLRST
jgi:hypothetical protein